MSLQYKETIDYLYSLIGLGIRPGLESTRGLLELLGNPESSLPAVHIAGTNGKGSTAAMIESVMREAGYNAGLYTSPHLTRFNERIALGGLNISDEDLIGTAAVVRGARERLKEEKGLEATFFEVSTAMALLYFRDQKADLAVLETGLGGSLDATNTVTPLLSIITNVEIDHVALLGATVKDIAGEKAGIIKEGVPVICGELGAAAASVIMERAALLKGGPLLRLGHEFTYERAAQGEFNFFGQNTVLKGVELGLHGAFQYKNAALALAVLEILSKSYPAINEEAAREGLRRVRWPGRFESLSAAPTVILDSAHNEAGARALVSAVKEYFTEPPVITLVTGISEDKDIDGMFAHLLPMARRIILTEADVERAAPVAMLQKKARAIRVDCEVRPSVHGAITAALEGLTQGEIVLIAGSVFVAGEAREFFSSVPAPREAAG
ncbi:MAG: bifunctional folylpolyglutamate synthase/dihydrofolate synthase [Thermodesulfobacteriota bacterium]